MKKILLTFAVCAFFLTGCTKEEPEPQVETVEVGTQIWTAYNYNGEGGVKPPIANPTDQMGKLYTQAEMKAITPPTGFRIPTKDDFEKLALSTGAVFTKTSHGFPYFEVSGQAAFKLLNTSSWLHGTNTTGFNALPTSGTEIDGYSVIYWCSSGSYSFFELYDSINESGFFIDVAQSGGNIGSKYSIRFVKDK